MPRAKTILQSVYPYSISARCINREWFNIPMQKVWDIFSEELYLTQKFYDLKIHNFVLMSNHFHLIATTPQSNLSQCMHFFMKATSRRLTQAGNRINQTYAGRYYKTILDSPTYYLSAYKYIYRNPVDANIVNRVEDYPYSSLFGLLGNARLLIPVEYDDTLFSQIQYTLDWLNQRPSPEKMEAVRWALKRPYFRSKKDRIKNMPILGENEIL